jgi:hypothetical protein
LASDADTSDDESFPAPRVRAARADDDRDRAAER